MQCNTIRAGSYQVALDLPEGDINELPGGILDVLIAAHEQHLDGLPLWRHGLLKDGKVQVLHRRHHGLHTLDDKVNAL